MKNIDHYKQLLEEEKAKLEAELGSVGRVNPDNPNDWESTPEAGDTNADADKNVQADAREEFEARNAVEVTLESRLINVKDALKRIEEGVFGKCEIDGKEIEEDRLEANPAARTCIEHKDENLE
ncbi:TraR/DksA family transcriptional regulator [Patescibacteria group bacterium]